MREIRKNLTREMFDPGRLNRIEALRKVIGNTAMIGSEDRKLITEALAVHAALIRMFSREKK